MKLSIIIPVYNVELYLSHCLDSCLNQDLSYSEYEIITINDGSIDESGNILDAYRQKYSNIKVISQENKGLSVARNIGILEAKGEYIWFVDSDDYIVENSLGSITTNGEDIIVFSKIYENVNDDVTLINRKWNNRVYLYNNKFNCGVKFYWFKRDFLILKKLFFIPAILHEDNDFTPKAFCLANNVAFFPSPMYFYRINRKGSIMSSVSVNRCFSLIVVAKSLEKFKNNLHDKNKECFVMNYLRSSLYSCLENWIFLSRNNRLLVIAKMRKELDLMKNIKLNMPGRIKIYLLIRSHYLLYCVLWAEYYLKKIL